MSGASKIFSGVLTTVLVLAALEKWKSSLFYKVWFFYLGAVGFPDE